MSQNIYLNEFQRYVKTNSILIQGLPGLGFVGKIAADFLIDQLKPIKLAELYSTYVALPDGDLGVRVELDGTFELPKYEFHGYEQENRSLIILTGEIQPAAWGQYAVATRVLDYADQIGCNKVVALGGHIIQGRRSDVVYAIGSSKEIIDELKKQKIQLAQAGAVKGAFGVLLGLAQQRKIPCLGLLGATPGTYPDLGAARNVLRVLVNMYQLPVSLEEIDKKILEMESRVKRFQEFQVGTPSVDQQQPNAPPVPRGYIS